MYSRVHSDKLTDLENIIFVCFGKDMEMELPQVEDEEDIVIDLLQERTHRARSEATSELYGIYSLYDDRA